MAISNTHPPFRGVVRTDENATERNASFPKEA